MEEERVCCPRCMMVSKSVILEPHPVKWGIKINCPNCGTFYGSRLKNTSLSDKTITCKNCNEEFLEEGMREDLCYYCTKRIKE